ncbi:YqiA/YcfP family alpha/beta fold hydrolase [Caballeronia glathei]|uniref:Esterase n=1 Tax=Caballeronia glathei TaxID=60547 RepID=A0A069PQH1_9BURK|nr:YqiA/YcfP family alpha/beta fold hydrolase [Caballeronia glathei]KDR42865.1 esterase [Caballeronia glathei]
MILYLHGFRSSPQSFKARVMRARLAELGRLDEWQCPVLPVSPREAIALAEKIAAGSADAHVTVIGSSLGGFYATYLAEKHGWRAVLLNPAVVPQRDLSHYLGEQPLWHGGGSIVVEPHHLDELRALAVESVTRPQRYYLIAATGDEVLDYRTMLDHYPGVRTTLIQGGDHAISDFPKYLDQVLAFCAPRPPEPVATAAA